jgi:ataxia telangiectasia mutated family protein
LAGDARSAVLQRLHHEEDWTQAFSYHGASYEVSSDRSENLPLVARSLRSFGFDALASTLLREVSGGLGHIPYDLAWRTRQWDVPIASTIRSGIGVEVFRTLRSVHHARNASQAWDVAKKSLHASFADFGTIGMENMAGIRAGIRSLLCLREVDLWFSDLQPLVQLDDFEDRKWAAFRTLPENME